MSKKIKYFTSAFLIICFMGIISFYFYKGFSEKPKLNIVFFDKEIEKYIEASNDLTANKDTIWVKYMQNPFDKIVNKYVPEDERSKASGTLFKAHFTSPEALKLYLDSSKNKQLKNAIQESYEKSLKLLGKENEDALNVVIIPYRGMNYGLTSASNLMVIYVNYLLPEEKLLNEVEGTFAHEYAHVVSLDFADKTGGWLKTYPNTFLGQMILEGKACEFAKLVVGDDYIQPMISSEPINDFEYYKNILNKEFTETTFFEYKVEDKSFLRTDCYYYGMKAVQEYIQKHKAVNPVDWMYLTPSQFYETNTLLLLR